MFSVARVLLFLLLTASAVESAEPIRVMTFNIRYDSGAGQASTREDAWLQVSGAPRRDRVLKMIDDAKLDLLGVQEALANQVQDIAEHLGEFDHYAVGRDDGASLVIATVRANSMRSLVAPAIRALRAAGNGQAVVRPAAVSTRARVSLFR